MSRSFDGIDDFLYFASAIKTAAPLSYACWIKPAAAPSASGKCIMHNFDNTGVSNCFRLQTGNGVNAAVIANARESGFSGEAVSTNPVPNTNWNHVCAVYTSTTSRAAYMNGVNKGTDTTLMTPASLAEFQMGLRADGGMPFDGLIAYAAFWNIALSDAQVLSLMTSLPGAVASASLLGLWNMSDNGATVLDTSGAARHLTISGATYNAAMPTIGSSGSSMIRRTKSMRGGMKELTGGMHG